MGERERHFILQSQMTKEMGRTVQINIYGISFTLVFIQQTTHLTKVVFQFLSLSIYRMDGFRNE